MKKAINMKETSKRKNMKAEEKDQNKNENEILKRY